MRLLQTGMVTGENLEMAEMTPQSPGSGEKSPDAREALRACLLGDAGGAVRTWLPVTGRADEICDFFEKAWIAGGVPVIEDYLSRVSPAEQPGLLCELVRLDADYRRQRGERPIAAEYLARFPEHVSSLVSVLHSDSELWIVSSASDLGVGQSEPRRGSEKVTAETRDARASGQTTLHACPDALRSIGHFTILDAIGEGGFGSVWKARDTQLERTVAIKIPRKDQLSDIELARFLNEARSAASLRHPHIVAVHEVSRDPDVPYIVTEYVDGVSLREWLGFRKISIPEAALLCAKLARALQHAHERHIVHRDIKPENILVDAKMEPHLADFGLAKHDRRAIALEASGSLAGDVISGDSGDQSPETSPQKHPTLGIREGAIFGTAAYMSPEQARGEGVRATAASDIYSLGVVLYELVTGRIPFRGTTLRVLLHQVQFEEPPLPTQINPDIPPELQAICLKALAKQTSARYTTAENFALELEGFLHGELQCAKQPPRLQRALTWGRRHWMITGGVVIASLSATVFAAVFMLSASPPAKGARVLIRTEPAGARVALVPLRTEDGSPDPSRMLHPSQTTPFEIDLDGGDYLIVAAVENHGFHEVYRHVPASRGERAGFLLHRFFKWTDQGTVLWFPIKIPDQSVVQGMALVPASNQPVGRSVEGNAARTLPFYLDATEFTVGEYKHLHHGELPRDLRESSPDDRMALANVSYDDAVALAEAAGKRLPDVAEFAQASTECGTRRFPWGNVWDPRISLSQPACVVGIPEFDRTTTEPAILGLYSNVFEWTTSGVILPTAKIDGARNGDHLSAGSVRKIIWPADIKFVKGKVVPVDRQREQRLRLSENERPGSPLVGFRCARSQRPRMEPDDFSPVSPLSNGGFGDTVSVQPPLVQNSPR